jgi:hypothetical protein
VRRCADVSAPHAGGGGARGCGGGGRGEPVCGSSAAAPFARAAAGEKGWQAWLYGALEDLFQAADWPWAAAMGWLLLGALFDASLLVAAP